MKNLTFTLYFKETPMSKKINFDEMKKLTKMMVKRKSEETVVDSLGSKCSAKRWLEIAEMFEKLERSK